MPFFLSSIFFVGKRRDIAVLGFESLQATDGLGSHGSGEPQPSRLVGDFEPLGLASVLDC